MSRHVKALALLGGMALAGPAFAQGETPKLGGFVLGARLGLAFPGGKIDRAASEGISYAVPVAVPFELDVGGRFSFGLGLGGYFQLAPAATDHCPAGHTCSALSFRLGVQGEYRFRNGERVMPWVGAGFGWEFFALEEKAGGQTTTATAWGPEGNVQGGVDFRLGRRWAIGPYLALHFARFDKEKVDGPAGNQTVTVPSGERATHTWTIVGVRSSVTF